MTTDYAECPLYKSKTYYGVVIGAEKYKGWMCVFAGDRSLHFEHENGEIKKFHRGREVGNWMAECWAEFLAMTEHQTSPSTVVTESKGG